MRLRPWRGQAPDRPPTADSNIRSNNPSQPGASTYLPAQRPPSELAFYTPFSTGHDSSTAQSESEASVIPTKPFPFLELPAELRELVYYHAVQPITVSLSWTSIRFNTCVWPFANGVPLGQPIDTGAIPGAPDRVRIPAIAQTSKQLRNEVLHVLFKHRPAEIRMTSAYSFERALTWAKNCTGNSNSFGIINFAGRLEYAQNEFYHVTLEISDESPYFEVRSRRGASAKADLIIAHVMEKLLNDLDAKVKAAKKGQECRLSGDSIADLIHLIDGSSRWGPPPET